MANDLGLSPGLYFSQIVAVHGGINNESAYQLVNSARQVSLPADNERGSSCPQKSMNG